MKLRILALCALLLLLAGCRVRVIDDALAADVVLQQQSVPETTQPPETQPPETKPPETEAPETEPPETEAPETQPPETAPPETQADELPEDVPQAPDQSPVGAGPVVPLTQPGEGGTQPGGEAPPETAAPAPVAEPAPEPPPETQPPAAAITVTLDPNGGDGGSLSVSVRPGETYGALPRVTRHGWQFVGWFTDREGGLEIRAQDVVTRTESHSLYAHWERAASTYTLTYDGNGGRVKSREATVKIQPGDLYGTMPTPLREGYEFLGWFTDRDSGVQISPGSTYRENGDQTLYAHWRYDPVAFWTFTLKNKTQQIYLCQQTTVYVETQQDNVTLLQCGLITDTGSLNAAANLSDPHTTDDWVLAKNPPVILKCVDSLAQAPETRAALAARFPGRRVILTTPDGLGGGSYGLYARLALAKALYPDWYKDVDLSQAAKELGLGYVPIQTG